MKFSLFFEMQISRPNRQNEAQTLRDCLEQAILGDKLGYHCIWEVEHHGLFEYSHSSAPEIFLSFVAAKTERIRVGHGIVLLPGRYNHPIRVAERVATLDVLSNGRVSFGTGKSSSLTEQDAFQCDRAQLHDQWLEAVEIIPRMWSADVFQHKGRYFDIPPTQVIPKPLQQPHPPIFAACSKPDSAAMIGRLGLGALNFAFGNDEYLAEKVTEYRAAVKQARPVGRAVNDWFACTPATLCLPDDKTACQYGFRGARFFVESMGRYYFSGKRPQGYLDVPRDFFPDADLQAAREARNAPGSQLASLIGDPIAVRESLSRWKEVGVDELILVMQMGTVPHELVMQSIRTFAEEVMPHFA